MSGKSKKAKKSSKKPAGKKKPAKKPVEKKKPIKIQGATPTAKKTHEDRLKAKEAKAEKLVIAGKTQKAIEAFEKLNKKYPDQKYAERIEELKKLLPADTASETAKTPEPTPAAIADPDMDLPIEKLEEKAEIAFGEKRYTDAIDLFQKCRKKNPTKNYLRKIEFCQDKAKIGGGNQSVSSTVNLDTVNLNTPANSEAAANATATNPTGKTSLEHLRDGVTSVANRSKRPMSQKDMMKLISRSHPLSRYDISFESETEGSLRQAVVVSEKGGAETVRIPSEGFFNFRA